jgi:GxxExxY protein
MEKRHDLTTEAQRTRRGFFEKMKINQLTGQVIGAAIEVHKALGPGLLESVYEECLCHELDVKQIPYRRQQAFPVEYKGVKIDCGYRIDLLVRDLVILELKSVDSLQPIHEAQLLTYLKLTGLKVGLLINFNVSVLKEGIKRLII